MFLMACHTLNQTQNTTGRHRVGPVFGGEPGRPEQGPAPLLQEAGAGGQGTGRVPGAVFMFLISNVCAVPAKQSRLTRYYRFIHQRHQQHTGRLRLRRQDEARVPALHPAPYPRRHLSQDGPARLRAERHPPAAGACACVLALVGK